MYPLIHVNSFHSTWDNNNTSIVWLLNRVFGLAQVVDVELTCFDSSLELRLLYSVWRDGKHT